MISLRRFGKFDFFRGRLLAGESTSPGSQRYARGGTQGIPSSLILCTSLSRSASPSMGLDSFPRGTGHLHPSCLALHPFLLPIPLFSSGVPTLHKPILAGIPKESKNWKKKLVICVDLDEVA